MPRDIFAAIAAAVHAEAIRTFRPSDAAAMPPGQTQPPRQPATGDLAARPRRSSAPGRRLSALRRRLAAAVPAPLRRRRHT